jgi:uncharacterized membrane protein YtjA (UPF0391 family)
MHLIKWAIIFGLVSLVSGWLGFGTLSGVTGTIAKVLFAIFLVIFLIVILAVIGLIHLL